MKKILSIFIIIATVSILLISNNTIAGPAWFAPGGVKTSTECNAAAYYADGTLCQDTDDNKLYLGTGAAVLEILSTTTGYALDAELSALAGLTSAANAIPYFTGSGTAGVISSSADMVSLLGSADYATARTNLGLGTLATQNADNVSVTNLTVSGAVNATSSTWTGLSANTTGNAATATSLAANPTDCAANTVATAIDATGNLTCGYALNADIQAYDADLDIWAGITPSTDIQAFLGAANDTAARTELGLGTIATQNADAINATGGNVTGLTNLGAANLTVTGTANVTGVTWTGLVPTFVDGSSSADLTVAQVSSTIIGNPTQSGNVTHVLPAIEAGLGFDAILGLTAAFYFRLDPNANDSIYLDGVSCGDGKYIRLTTVTAGDAISCRAMKTGASAYDWACYTAKGAFACE